VSIDAGPPAQPPQLSPDGNWVWDGSQWQPVAGVGAAPAHAGVFKAYDAMVVEPVAPTIEAAPPAVQYEQQYPLPVPTQDYSYGGSQPDLTPLWQQTKGGGYGRYLYFVAAIALFVMVLIVLSSMNFVQLPFINAKSNQNQAVAKPSPTPDTSGPDSARADRFVSGTLKPELDAVDQIRPAVYQWCSNGNLSSNCFDSLTSVDQALTKLLSGIDTGDIPACIAVPMRKVRSDVHGMKDQVDTALKDFQSNDKSSLASAVYNFSLVRKSLDGNVAATVQAQKKCFTVVLPTWVPY
jgi:hypothetical protein